MRETGSASVNSLTEGLYTLGGHWARLGAGGQGRKVRRHTALVVKELTVSCENRSDGRTIHVSAEFLTESML